MKSAKGLIGTAKFMSLNTNLGYEASRRDDLESLIVILIYFRSGGKLPWDLPYPKLAHFDSQSTKAIEIQMANDALIRKWKKSCLEVKQSISTDELCRNVLPQFKECLDHIRSLKFEETPNYKMIRTVFKKLLEDIEGSSNFEFDWVTQRQHLIAKKLQQAELEQANKSSGLNNLA